MTWLQRKLESLTYWKELFNKAVSEKNNDGAFEASQMLDKIRQEVKEFTGWSDLEVTSKY